MMIVNILSCAFIAWGIAAILSLISLMWVFANDGKVFPSLMDKFMQSFFNFGLNTNLPFFAIGRDMSILYIASFILPVMFIFAGVGLLSSIHIYRKWAVLAISLSGLIYLWNIFSGSTDYKLHGLAPTFTYIGILILLFITKD